MCLLNCAILYTGFPYNLNLCRVTPSMSSGCTFFLHQKKSPSNKDVRQPVRMHAVCQDGTETQVVFFPCCGFTTQTWRPGHDHTEQKYTQKNLKHCAFWINTGTVQMCLPHKKHKKKIGPVCTEYPLRRLRGRCTRISVGTWLSLLSLCGHLHPVNTAIWTLVE